MDVDIHISMLMYSSSHFARATENRIFQKSLDVEKHSSGCGKIRAAGKHEFFLSRPVCATSYLGRKS